MHRMLSVGNLSWNIATSGDSKGGLGELWLPQIFAWPPVWSPQFFLNFPLSFFG